MGKRRNKKKQQQKIIRSVITLCLVLLIGLLSFLLKPWETPDDPNPNDGTPSSTTSGQQGNQKPNVGNKTESDLSDLQVHYIDVGQADSILVRVPTEDGTKNILIDAGAPLNESSKDKITTEYLSDQGIDTLHYMIITHPHFDHASAAEEVIEAFHVENIILPECDPRDTNKAFWRGMLEAMDAKNLEYIPSVIGDIYQIGEASFEILGPVDTSNVKDVNDYSIVIRLDYGETSFLFTGDAEEASEEAMLRVHPVSKFKCDVLKVGHHGSDSSTSEAFLAAANPTLAIIQCGEGNDYGHPKKLILDRLENAGVSVLRTDYEGTIIICSDKEAVFRLTTSK
ncbi:MAG: MBL fold metallo-hydrolase [Clostridia bacterium]|nr:MBL fold metallo-hydrolase [Clostridia bacterium]